jgi:hypothetical protein
MSSVSIPLSQYALRARVTSPLCCLLHSRRVDEGLLTPVLGRQSDLSGGPKLLEAKERGGLPGKVSISVR